MNLKRMWQKEARRRKSNDFRKDRMVRNWPIHAQRAVEVFSAFAMEAAKDGVRLTVTGPAWSDPTETLGEFIIGSSSVHMRFATQYTGEGLITRTAERETKQLDLERGSELILHHSPSDGTIQVFFEHPTLRNEEEDRKEPLLYAFTYNTDQLTNDWLASLIPPFLTFNRVESRLELPSYLDTCRMRWWRFTDIRNRRGYLNTFQHLLTPWELVLMGAFAAIPSVALIKWVWEIV